MMKFVIIREKMPIYEMGSCNPAAYITSAATYSITNDDGTFYLTKEEFYKRIKLEKYKKIPTGCQLSFDF
jgi:hypothetical protein